MAQSPTTTSRKTSSEVDYENNKHRIAQLRQQQRDLEKSIKQLESTTRRDKDMADWKRISDLKQTFIKQLKAHPQLKRMSWKRFISTDDYFIYALNVGQYTHYAVDDKAEWVQKQVAGGKDLVELEANAKRMREARWNREQKRYRASKKVVKTTPENPEEKGTKLKRGGKEYTDEEIHGSGTLEESLGNG